MTHSSWRHLHLFRDDTGRIVLWQWPNLPLWGWLVCKALSPPITAPHLTIALSRLSTAFLFTWAYLELVDGVNYARRLLGLAVIIGIIASFYRL
jgi:hypothetical protein